MIEHEQGSAASRESSPRGCRRQGRRAWLMVLGASVRRRLSYANVAATLACVFVMSGATLAATSPPGRAARRGHHRYLIDSVGQIEPRVLRELRGRDGRDGTPGATGATGATGHQGVPGPQGWTGPRGPTGPVGLPGAAGTPFDASLSPGGGEQQSQQLFELTRDGVSATLVCGPGPVAGTMTAAVTVAAPEGSRAQTGMVAVNATSGKPPEGTSTPVISVKLGPAVQPIAQLTSNERSPYANVGQFDGSITTPAVIVSLDAFVEAAPSSPGPACTVRGTVFSVPLS